MTNPKAIPWNYKPTVITYKGKEVNEEVDEVGGMTHSGRCYAPAELRKTKNDQMPVKNPVTEEEAEEFLRKMKLLDYFIVEQLRKTPAQISLLSLLIHSNEQRKAVMKILNEEHVSNEVTISQLEKIAGRIFEVNQITFSNDELPMEGTGHNQGLHITVKCELSYVTRVLIDGRSGANICPFVERVRPNIVCVRAFDGSKTDAIGEIDLVITIGPIDFTVNFQVLKIDASYNLLLGRPRVHRDGVVPSTLHEMGDLSIYKVYSLPFIKANNETETLVYQALEVVVVEHILEGILISKPQLPMTSVMMVNEMLKHGFEPGKGLGIFLQGRAYPVYPCKSFGTFGLGYKPTIEDKMKAKKHKRKVWSLTKPIPPIYKSFIRTYIEDSLELPLPKPVLEDNEELINYF
ncbi:hypothetical protein R3W88_033622 [Solanum pinnatisectum]|uniref:G-patch domain-containing protein n=1 Tax=Solanum pinnatisectum TaxID=50273 RepID=A0AAV9K0I1_9SOLN|nr:hypothetical protein R3W88_033622 [Solanum pinnatisectum]